MNGAKPYNPRHMHEWTPLAGGVHSATHRCECGALGVKERAPGSTVSHALLAALPIVPLPPNHPVYRARSSS